MPTAWTLAQIQAKVGNDLSYVDGNEQTTFQQLSANGATLASYSNVTGWGSAEQGVSVDGLEVIAREWSLQANQFAAVTRINETDQVVDAAGAVWVLRNAQLIVWDTEWRAQGVRVDCLISIAGVNIDVELMVTSQDALGGFTGTPSKIYISVPCRFQSLGSETIEDTGKKYQISHHAVYTRQSGIVVGMRLNLAGKIFRVTGVTTMLQRNPSFPTWYVVNCEIKSDEQG